MPHHHRYVLSGAGRESHLSLRFDSREFPVAHLVAFQHRLLPAVLRVTGFNTLNLNLSTHQQYYRGAEYTRFYRRWPAIAAPAAGIASCKFDDFVPSLIGFSTNR